MLKTFTVILASILLLTSTEIFPIARFLKFSLFAFTNTSRQESLAPFVPTPELVVQRMLELADVTSSDVVYDLGCGDGRIVIAAASKYGARGVGIDIDPVRIAESKANAKKAGVEHLVEFRLQDVMEVDLKPATVVTVYLLSHANLKLRPRLTEQLALGSRVVSHAFDMGDWKPNKIDKFDDRYGFDRTLYLWTIDGTKRP